MKSNDELNVMNNCVCVYEERLYNFREEGKKPWNFDMICMRSSVEVSKNLNKNNKKGSRYSDFAGRPWKGGGGLPPNSSFFSTFSLSAKKRPSLLSFTGDTT